MICEKHYITDDSEVVLVSYCHETNGEMPNKPRFPAVVVCPGGAYNICSPREADPIALHYSAAGYNTFVLYYSLKEKAVFPRSLLDLCAALKFIRENAERFFVKEDNIAVCGFSAGGHLAASLGVHWNNPEIMEKSGCMSGENKPNALILGYPVLSTSWIENSGNLGRIMGEDADFDKRYKDLNLQTCVSENTPQSFLVHTVRDNSVPVEDSIKFASALIEKGVPCELHLFPNGYHGLADGTPVTNSGGGDKSFAQWIPLSIGWLNRLFGNPEEANKPLEKARYSSKL